MSAISSLDQEYSTGKSIETDLKRMMIECSIPRSRMIADSDGLGSYLESYLNGIREFHGGTRPINPEYDNLKSECAFKPGGDDKQPPSPYSMYGSTEGKDY